MSNEIVLERLPDEVMATIEARDRALTSLGNAGGGLEFVITNLRRWIPGATVRVAFLGGAKELHRDIEDVTRPIVDNCNLTLDFGFDAETGSYRIWSESDTEYAAEIRISFDQRGFFSLVGTDSVASNIGPLGGAVGGRPGQRSLNLGGFDIQRPSTWRGTILHEFLHALGFSHEHVNLRGPCQQDFRFEDDPGYVLTQNSGGVFISDFAGRRPGIYTYLSGAPNFWPKTQVDHNLRPGGEPVIEGLFDRASVMLYRFPNLFYRTPNSGCAPDGDGQTLSTGDIAGLRRLYPQDLAEVEGMVGKKQATLAGVSQAIKNSAPPITSSALEAAAVSEQESGILQSCYETLRLQLDNQ